MECYKDYYIHNFKLKLCSEFNEDILFEGTSIYEVIRIENGVAIFLEDHLSRLFDSAELSKLEINESYCDIETLIVELIKKNNTKTGKIKLIIRFDENRKEKDLLVYFTPHYFPSGVEYKKGVKIGICKTERSNPNVKVLNSNARRIANNRIAEEKLFEVLLLNANGFITEGSRSNVFFVKNNVIYTPLGKDVLNGVTRRNIIKLCNKNNINISEKSISYKELKDMDSVFLTGTSLKIIPVNKINEIEFNTNNKLLNQLQEIYNNAIQEYIRQKTIPTN